MAVRRVVLEGGPREREVYVVKEIRVLELKDGRDGGVE